jgi:preprotein translocase subunit SecA
LVRGSIARQTVHLHPNHVRSNAEFLAQAEAGTRDRTDPSYVESLEKFTAQCAEERKKVVAAGGLFVMGTERHEARPAAASQEALDGDMAAEPAR